jgi:adenylate kinase
LEKRSDDDLNTIIKRHDTYMKTTSPVLDYYSQNSNFYEIDGTSEIGAITAKIDEIINV